MRVINANFDEKTFNGIDFKRFKTLGDYDNIVIVDQDGIIVFYDFADLNQTKLLSIDPEKMVGNKITSIWADLTDENSTLMSHVSITVQSQSIEEEYINIEI
ncbi:MAG: hypothetical protein GX892_03825 [Thermoanaerobacteraceae bacterium]|nr:hypothetical protein [Thermoanaerobacteraceae bacterium]